METTSSSEAGLAHPVQPRQAVPLPESHLAQNTSHPLPTSSPSEVESGSANKAVSVIYTSGVEVQSGYSQEVQPSVGGVEGGKAGKIIFIPLLPLPSTDNIALSTGTGSSQMVLPLSPKGELLSLADILTSPAQAETPFSENQKTDLTLGQLLELFKRNPGLQQKDVPLQWVLGELKLQGLNGAVPLKPESVPWAQIGDWVVYGSDRTGSLYMRPLVNSKEVVNLLVDEYTAVLEKDEVGMRIRTLFKDVLSLLPDIQGRLQNTGYSLPLAKGPEGSMGKEGELLRATVRNYLQEMGYTSFEWKSDLPNWESFFERMLGELLARGQKEDGAGGGPLGLGTFKNLTLPNTLIETPDIGGTKISLPQSLAILVASLGPDDLLQFLPSPHPESAQAGQGVMVKGLQQERLSIEGKALYSLPPAGILTEWLDQNSKSITSTAQKEFQGHLALSLVRHFGPEAQQGEAGTFVYWDQSWKKTEWRWVPPEKEKEKRGSPGENPVHLELALETPHLGRVKINLDLSLKGLKMEWKNSGISIHPLLQEEMEAWGLHVGQMGFPLQEWKYFWDPNLNLPSKQTRTSGSPHKTAQPEPTRSPGAPGFSLDIHI